MPVDGLLDVCIQDRAQRVKMIGLPSKGELLEVTMAVSLARITAEVADRTEHYYWEKA